MRNGNERSSRVWFVTGASRGFGRALAEAALARGEHVIATSRGEDFVEDFAQRHPAAAALRVDVTDRERRARALKRAVDGGGGRAELLGDLAGREAEDIAQDQHGALRGDEVLQRGDERQLDALAFLVAGLRRQWVGLQPQRLAERLAGTGGRVR